MAVTNFKGGTSKVAAYDQSLAIHISLNDVFALGFDYSHYTQLIFPIFEESPQPTTSFLFTPSD